MKFGFRERLWFWLRLWFRHRFWFWRCFWHWLWYWLGLEEGESDTEWFSGTRLHFSRRQIEFAKCCKQQPMQ
ncbi:MAG: hypothetical protein KDI47_01975 [Gammaproteobacteria bacterium]|nr:hypothetical protein [Gammaproteobacteria bacterium]